MNGGTITKNRNGIAVRGGSSVTLVAAEITGNRVGVASEMTIPKKVAEMVFDNSLDIKTVTSQEMITLLKPPESVKSIVLPKSQTEVKVSNDFKSGFSAMQAEKEQTTSILGNVTVGVKYFSPTSTPNPRNDSLIPQTRYLGEQSSDWYSGIQPEMNLFLQGKNAGADITFNADLYGNDWLSTQAKLKKNLFAL
jgi:hypothetical protein